MAILVQCPNPACRASCSVAEANGGGAVRCPKCLKPFVVRPTVDWRKGDTHDSPAAADKNPFPALPAEFGRYRVLKLLGRGGMGAVYLAQDSQLGRQVALKVPFFDGSESAQRAERFVREARSAAVLQHPNICTLFDAGQIDGRPFITMAYIAGKPLEDEIDPDAPMPQARAAGVARKIALALEHAHRAGIVHRDLKPANVMMTAGGEPVVMDFGLAKRVADVDPKEARLTRDGGVLGTPSYMSPEQCRGEAAAVGPATDVYSLGVMLFEMLTGRTPYTGALSVVIGRILTAPPPPVREFRPDADPRLDAVCRKAMAKEPAERFASMAEFADALDKYLRAPSASPPPLPAAPPAAVRRGPPPADGRSPFAELGDAPARAPALKRVERGRAAATALRPKWPVLVGAAAALLLAVLGTWWASGVLRVKTADGAIVLENLPADAEVFVDGKKVALKLNGDDKPIEIQAAPGNRRLEIRTAGFKIEAQDVTLAAGERKPISVRLEPLAGAPEKPAPINPLMPPPGEPGAPARADGSRLYLSDLKEFDLVVLDGHFRDGFDANGIVVNGEKVKKGLMMHPLPDKYASVKYRLDGLGVSFFEAKAAINDTALDGSASPLTFQVLGDGKTLWTSQPVQAPRRVQDCGVKVEGVHVLELRVVCGNDYRSAVAVWLDPCLLSTKADDSKAPGTADAPPAAVVTDGFTPLFNGRDLTGWSVDSGAAERWKVEEGQIKGTGAGSATRGWLLSNKEYENYVLNMEFRVAAEADGAVGVRARPGETMDGLPHHLALKLTGYAKPDRPQVGALYYWPNTWRQPKAAGVAPAGEWNRLGVRMQGDELRVSVNGQEIQNLSLGEFTKTVNVFPGARRSSGRIGLQQHTGEVRFRNIEIKELPPTNAAPAPPADPFQVNSIWADDKQRMTLTVTERTGETFQARFVIGETIDRKVSGKVKDGKLFWLAKDVRADKGGVGGDNQATISHDQEGDFLDFTYGANGRTVGAFVLRPKTGK